MILKKNIETLFELLTNDGNRTRSGWIIGVPYPFCHLFLQEKPVEWEGVGKMGYRNFVIPNEVNLALIKSR